MRDHSAMYDEYACFRLTRPIPDQPIPVGTVGVVLMIFPGDPVEYEVEFVDPRGNNLGLTLTHTIGEDSMEPV